MLDEKSQTELTGQVRTTQVIVAALCMGIVSFAAYAIVTGPSGEPPDDKFITIAAACLAPVCIVLSLIATRVAVTVNRRKIADGTWKPASQQGPAPSTDAGKLAFVYQVKTIIGAALIEGPAFLALLAYMIEGSQLSLAVAGVMLLGVMAHFPTASRVETWIEGQLQMIKEQRQFSS